MSETVTILFTDVEGSTELRAREGDDRAQDILRAQERILRERIESAGGRVVKALGDGVMAAFGSARSAVRCAVDIQRDVAADGATRVRVGVHTGEVTEEAGDLFGQAVHAAARIMGRARGGQILVPAVVKDLAEGNDVAFHDRGLFWLKGFGERWRLWEVDWREEAAAALATEPGELLPERAPLVGRESELADLRRALDVAAEGHGSLVLIGGEPGVGKTRLAEEAAAEAEGRGMRVLIGHCSEMEGALPYMPWVEILEQALARAATPEAFRGLLGENAGEIARILPELRRLFDDIAPPLDLPPEQERRYLFNSIRDFIGRGAQLRPMVLVLDDLHWADEPSLLLLQHVAETLAEAPVLILGTYRDVELETGRPLARAIEELRRRRLMSRVSLKRLTEEGVAAMLTGLSGQTAPPELARIIFTESDGNAFFVEEVFHHLMEEGRLFDEAGGWRRDLNVDEIDVPESVRLVIGRRLDRVSEETRKVLTSAAMLGKFFDLGVLETVAGCDEDALLDALDAAERAKLVAPADGLDRFGFAHELIRQTLLAELSTLRRQRLHLRVADALEAAAGDRLGEVAGDLAYHLMQAGAGAPVERTGRALLLAGERALQAAGFEQAVRYLESAASLPGALDARDAAGLMDALGRAYAAMGRWDDAIEAWDRALDGFERLKDEETVGRIAYPMTVQLAWAARFEDAIMSVGRGLHALGDRVSADRVRLLMNAALLFGGGGYTDAAEEMLADATKMADELGDEQLSAEVLAFLAIVRWEMSRFGDVIELGMRAQEVLLRTGAVWERVQLLGFVALAFAFTGGYAQADDLIDEALGLARHVGHQGAELTTHRARLGVQAARDGWGPALAAGMEEDERIARQSGLPWIAESFVWKGMLEFAEGRWDRALASFEEAFGRENPGAFAGWERGPLIRHLAYLGEAERAMTLWDGHGVEFPPAGESLPIGATGLICFGVEALALLGRHEAAAALYPRLEGISPREMGRVYDIVPIDRLLGIAAACGGDWAAAEGHFDAADMMARDWPILIDQAEGPRWRAWTLLLRDGPGDRDRAAGFLEAARARYRELGMPRHVELAEGMLERRG